MCIIYTHSKGGLPSHSQKRAMFLYFVCFYFSLKHFTSRHLESRQSFGGRKNAVQDKFPQFSRFHFLNYASLFCPHDWKKFFSENYSFEDIFWDVIWHGHRVIIVKIPFERYQFTKISITISENFAAKNGIWRQVIRSNRRIKQSGPRAVGIDSLQIANRFYRPTHFHISSS